MKLPWNKNNLKNHVVGFIRYYQKNYPEEFQIQKVDHFVLSKASEYIKEEALPIKQTDIKNYMETHELIHIDKQVRHPYNPTYRIKDNWKDILTPPFYKNPILIFIAGILTTKAVEFVWNKYIP